jgi:hypothetical protein
MLELGSYEPNYKTRIRTTSGVRLIFYLISRLIVIGSRRRKEKEEYDNDTTILITGTPADKIWGERQPAG